MNWRFSDKPVGKYILWGLGGGAIMAVSVALGMLTVLYFQVYFGDDSQLKKTTIMARINEETSLYFLDEQTRIGSFFDDRHRRYVPIDEVPAHLINAMVASEDKYFYEHSGVNPIAIFKAFFEGVQEFFRTGHPHFRGGSTITQQTVKNVLEKKEYSLGRKFREAIAALQLERLYSKRQILEFYLNQFHVAANGNGIGIAARYYFNKDVRDLDLVEAAFIAGSVKAPSKYNPFIKFSAEIRKEAWQYANQRKNYVLRRMFEQGWINEAELREAWDKPVPFNKGKFTSREVALVSLIRSQLNKKEILEAINLDNISELNSAGLKIYTTLDAPLQESAQLMMRRNLSKLETILQGFKAEDPAEYRPLPGLDVDEFYYAKVEKVVKTGKEAKVLLDFGLPKGTIPYDSLVRYAKLMDVAIPKTWESRFDELVNAIKPGDTLFVEVREYDQQTHQAVVELHRRPVISGGLIVLDKGEVRALISGFDSQGYNRAIFATRQPGSVFKSAVYYAAMQLGWTMLDSLDNERRLFPYQGQFYYPQPDHASPYKDVSMLWSGVKSENLAAIYLTSRMVEKLNVEQFKGLLGFMDLLPKEDESKRDYHYRVAKKVGVQLDNDGIREFQLGNAVNDIVPDLVFSGEQDLLRKIKKMWWGRGYAAELQRLYIAEEEEVSEKEKLLRVDLVKNNYQRHAALAAQLENDWNQISSKVEENGPEAVLADSDLMAVASRFRVVPGKGNRPALGYFRIFPDEEPKASDGKLISLESTPGRSLNALDMKAIWGRSGLFTTSANIELKDVRLSGYMPLEYFKRIQQKLDERYNAVMAIEEPYDLAHYFHHHDFRVAVGLEYLRILCESMGVFSKIEPVLSFPLGTNVVSVAEVAKVYQTFIDGKIYKFYEDGPPNQLNFIRRIEDRFGNVLYQPETKEYQLVREEYSAQMRQILRKVVTHGTGGRARGELYIDVGLGEGNGAKEVPIRIPAYGKTGTTNDYMTASFAGFLPYPTAKRAPLDPSNSYVIASYVGYDFNKEMVRGGYKISGGFGALPVWTDVAKSIIKEKNYTDYLDKLDLKIISNQEWPVTYPQDTVNVKVDLPHGLVMRAADVQDREIFATTNLDVTGEKFINEFALDASVQSVVRIPVDGSQGVLSPLRMVSLLTKTKEEDTEKDKRKGANSKEPELPPVPMAVDPGAAGRLPGQDAPSQDVSLHTPVSPDRPVDRVKTSVEKKPGEGGSDPGVLEPQPKPSVNEILEEMEEDKAKKPAQKPQDRGSSDPGFIEEELW